MGTEISTQTGRGLALQSFDDAFRFAGLVANSEFAPKDFRGKPESCLLAIQHGSEVGLSPMQSLQSIAVINGRPTIWGDAALALVQSSPVCEYVYEFTEGEGESLVAVCQTKRRGYGQPNEMRFSMADAKRAGLVGKAGPWTQYPARMLALRARGFALRNAFADVLRGLITAEEAQDYPAVPASHVEPKRPQPVVSNEEPLFDRITRHIVDATNVRTLGRIGDRVDELSSEGQLTVDQASELHDRINRRHNQIEPEASANGVA